MDGQEITYVAWDLPQEFTELYLIPISDIHKGNPFFSEKHLKRTIEFIERKPNAYWLGNGDWIEAATRTSKSDVYSQTESPDKQASWCVDNFQGIASKGLGFDSGNHEGRVYDSTGIDIASHMARDLDIPYSPEGMLVKISFGGGNSSHADRPYVFWIYMTHGYGGARTRAAKSKKVEDQSHYIKADVQLMSHDHVVNVAPAVELAPDNRTYPCGKRWRIGKVKANKVMLVKTSAYLKWGGYSQRFGYSPSDLTTPIIKLMTPQSPLWENYPDRPKQTVKIDV